MGSINFKLSFGVQATATYRKSIDPATYLKGHRQVKVRVEIDFPSGTESFSGNSIKQMTLLEEATSGKQNPLGFVSANELSLSLDNSSGRFTVKDPLEVEIRPGLEIRPFIEIIDGFGSTGEIPMGVFWCGEWEAPTNSLVATTVAYDRLANLITLDTPQIPPMTETTIGEMFGRLFRALGFSSDKYEISPALMQKVLVGWFPRDKVGQSLQLLAEAGNCYVSVNKEDKFVVMPNIKTGFSTKSYTDKNAVFSINSPQRFLELHTAVKVVYRLPYLKDPNEELIRVDNIRIPKNETIVLDRIDFKSEDVPIMEVGWVHIFGEYNLPEIWEVSVGDSTGGTFLLGDGGGEFIQWTDPIAYNLMPEPPGRQTQSFTGDGSTAVFQVANYPLKQDTVDVWIDHVEQTNGTDYTINYATGEITFIVPPEDGSEIVVRYFYVADNVKDFLEAVYGEGSITTVTKRGSVYTITFHPSVGNSSLTSNFDELVGVFESEPYLDIVQEYVSPMNSKVVLISYGATDITLTIQNNGDVDETINIRVKGVGTGYHESHRIAKDEELAAQFGHKEYTQENPLVQTWELAKDYSEKILDFVSDPMSFVEVDFRGDPLLSVGDIITVSDETNEIKGIQIVPRMITTTYEGRLRATMDARRTK